jgi:YggT family protein
LQLLAVLIDLYSLIVLAAVVMSWVGLDPRHPAAAVAHTLTEPLLGPIRKALPPIGGLDVSPMLLLFALRLLRNFVR